MQPSQLSLSSHLSGENLKVGSTKYWQGCGTGSLGSAAGTWQHLGRHLQTCEPHSTRGRAAKGVVTRSIRGHAEDGIAAAFVGGELGAVGCPSLEEWRGLRWGMPCREPGSS